MGSARQLLVWVTVAVAASTLLAGVIRWERGRVSARWSALPIGRPQSGGELFQRKGCARCHTVNGVGGSMAPELGLGRADGPHQDQLVVAMWNHAPRMWERMQEEQVETPKLDVQEIADLFAYLTAARSLEASGDAVRGERLYASKGCVECHPLRSPSSIDRGAGSDALRKAASSVAWARAMWNHPAPAEGHPEPPRFEGAEMNDLVTFARNGRRPRLDRLLLAGDPDRGWKLFQEKSCIACHPLEELMGQDGPSRGPGSGRPSDTANLATAMWNHSAANSRTMREKGVARPRFDSPEMADLISFLNTFRTSEPGGSPKLGEMLYEGRGCIRCHGSRAEGGKDGPGLRGRGRRFTSISFAAALWRHGPKMYRRAHELGLSWPDLSEGDVGNLMTFLNSTSAVAR
jgi:mono/diheme cytochrome c family protein